VALDDAVATLRKSFDSVHGGWGRRPKFPQASVIEFLLARDEQPMALQTLRSMAGGGIFDQVGGGFSRYSVDARWTVPHFEKIALRQRAAGSGLPAWLSGQRRCAAAAHGRGDARLGPAGDARARGRLLQRARRRFRGRGGQVLRVELDELRAALGDDAEDAIAWFGATERGNFEGANILESRGPEPPPSSASASRDPARRRAPSACARPRRQAPGRLERADDRRAGRCRRRPAARGLPRRRARRRGVRARPDALARRPAAAHLQRRRRALDAYLEDHAFLLEALLVLYEATFEERWFIEARALADTIVARFADDRARRLLLDRRRPRGAHRAAQGPRGHADPGGGLVGRASGLLRLAALTGEQAYEEQAAGQLALLHELAVRHPNAFGHLLQALDLYLAAAARGRPGRRPGGRRGAGGRRARDAPAAPGARRPVPGDGPTAVALMEQRTAVDGRAAAYVCERFACRTRSPRPTSCGRCSSPSPGRRPG
jgi:uncharacterized protein YyaL (SSP411 family)